LWLNICYLWLTSPLKLMLVDQEASICPQELRALSCHGLREYVSYLEIIETWGSDITRVSKASWIEWFNMLHTLMVYRISSYLNGTSVISMKRSRIRLRKTKLSQKPTKQDNLRTSSRHCPVFEFSRRFRNASLFLTLPSKLMQLSPYDSNYDL